MGTVRSWPFEAVIGIGGSRPDRGHEDIARKINWVGIGPIRTRKDPRDRKPTVTFEQFVLFEESGPEFEKLAPNLFRNMFVQKHVRVVLSDSLPPSMQNEVQQILRWACESMQFKQRHPKLEAQEEEGSATRAPVCKKKQLSKRGC